MYRNFYFFIRYATCRYFVFSKCSKFQEKLSCSCFLFEKKVWTKKKEKNFHIFLYSSHFLSCLIFLLVFPLFNVQEIKFSNNLRFIFLSLKKLVLVLPIHVCYVRYTFSTLLAPAERNGFKDFLFFKTLFSSFQYFMFELISEMFILKTRLESESAPFSSIHLLFQYEQYFLLLKFFSAR